MNKSGIPLNRMQSNIQSRTHLLMKWHFDFQDRSCLLNLLKGTNPSYL